MTGRLLDAWGPRLRAVHERAEAALGTAWPQPPASGGMVLLCVYPPAGARATLLRWDPARAAATLTVRELDDPLLAAVRGQRLTRLALGLPDTPHGSLTVEVGVHQ